MALDQSALLEVLDALKAADVDDRVRQAAETIYQALIEAELTAVIGAGPHERHRDAAGAAQRAPAADAVDDGRGSGAADPEAADRVVLPVAAGAAPPGRSGPVRGGDGGLPARRLHPQGRRPGQGARRRHRDLQVRGVPDLRRPRRRGRRLPRPQPGRGRRSPTCSSTPPTARPGSTAGSSPRPWWSPPGSAPTGGGRCSASPSATREDGAFWTAFLRSLKARGLAGVQLVISDAHTGLKQAIAGGAARRGLATVPGPLPAQRAGPGPEGQRRDGRRRDPHHLRPTRRQPCPRAARRDRRHARPATPQGRDDAARRRRRPARLHRLPGRALEEDLVAPTRWSG